MSSQDRPRLQSGLDATVPHHHTAYKIIGIAMDVHNKLGPGHREEVYQQAMLKKLPEAGLTSQEQVPVEVTLDGQDLLTYYLDLLVEEAVIVELKAHYHPLTNDDLAQVIDYLAATGFPVALLLNFGRSRLEYRRILPPHKITIHRRREWTKPPPPS